MTNIVALNTQTHRDLRVQTEASARFGDARHFVPVVVNEFAFLTVHYPIFFAKDSETGAFYCGAMLGIDEGENLFLTEEAGFETYRPLHMQRGPFFTAGSDIAIDLDDPRVNSAGQALFTEDGQPSDYLKSIMGLLRDLRPGLDQTKVFIETLMKLKLIEPIDISLAFDDGTRRNLEGLYTVNQDVLKKLADARIVELFHRGYLQAIYLMIASLKQIPVLAQKKNARLAG
ncbi:MAG TPA: SapC family protein [Rhizomicrobium sp.]